MFGRSDRLRNLADELIRRDTKQNNTHHAIQSSDYYAQEKDNTSASETSKSHYGGAGLDDIPNN